MAFVSVNQSTGSSVQELAASDFGAMFPGLRMTAEGRTAPPPILNTIAVRELANGASALMYYGRRFDVPRVPYPLGLELDRIRRRRMQLVVDVMAKDITEDQAAEETGTLMDDAVAIFAKLARAHGRVHRFVIWAFRINPFAKSSHGDFAELLGFFCACRMRSGVQS